jgi:hypothetical protein
VLIRSWFELVEQTKLKYGILDEDVYNFDEAGFTMGRITTQLVVTWIREKRLAKVYPA